LKKSGSQGRPANFLLVFPAYRSANSNFSRNVNVLPV